MKELSLHESKICGMLVVANSVSKNSCQAALKSDMKLQNSSAPVKWDSGNKPEIDNTYYVYNCGNDGLYHLALAEEVRSTPTATLLCFLLPS